MLPIYILRISKLKINYFKINMCPHLCIINTPTYRWVRTYCLKYYNDVPNGECYYIFQTINKLFVTYSYFNCYFSSMRYIVNYV